MFLFDPESLLATREGGGRQKQTVSQKLLLTTSPSSFPSLNRTKVGDYIGMRGKDEEAQRFHKNLLSAFSKRFSFHDCSLVHALRLFLSSFRLPGEAQVIDRIMQAFADSYVQQQQQLINGGSLNRGSSYSPLMLPLCSPLLQLCSTPTCIKATSRAK